MKKIPTFLVIASFAFSNSVFAEIYKRIDADGRITYSNIKTKGATRLDFDPDENIIGNDKLKNLNNSSSTNKHAATPEGFPKIDKQTQSQRDNKRQDILQSELESERVALEEAKKAYAEGESKPEIYKSSNGTTLRNMSKFQEKMKSLQNDVDTHENNIKLLQKELDSLH